MPGGDEIREGQRATWAGLSAGWEKWDSVILDQLGPVGTAMIERLGIADDQQHLGFHAAVMFLSYSSHMGADSRGRAGTPWQASPGPPDRAERRSRRADVGVAGNARLTAANGAVLLVLLAAEGATILRIRPLLSPHVFLGAVLIPPLLVKVASTTWRFARYYGGAPAYRRKGPPPVALRLLGPAVVILTLVLLASGLALMLAARSWMPLLLKVHKVSFVLWFGAMTIHVLGHLGEVLRLAPQDWLRRTRHEVTGAAPRQWLIVASLIAGALLGFVLLSRVGTGAALIPSAG